jgi:hypothetical protein
MRLILFSAAAIFLVSQITGCGNSDAQSPTPVIANATTPAPINPDWSFLAGTTWIVPPTNLNAYELQGTALPTGGSPTTNPPTIVRLQDQTVYQITGYANGYFWGLFSVTLGVGSTGTSPASACGTLLSPITPEGNLIISTTTLQTPLTQNWGTGQMVWKKVNGVDQWTMQNWKVGGYVHWAYMIQTTSAPSDPYWLNLPYLGVSVPTVLNAPGCASNWTPVNPS